MSCWHSIIYGPVFSRRLGNSLGIDIIPAKICSLDCVYCECGKTTELTNERKEYVSADKIISELDEFLGNYPVRRQRACHPFTSEGEFTSAENSECSLYATQKNNENENSPLLREGVAGVLSPDGVVKPQIDVITFAGSGEPLLNSGAGKIISHIKEKYPQYKVAFITNSLLLSDKNAREEILSADFVLPSLDAMFQESFEKINCPVKGISVNSVLDGLREFAKIYKGKLWVELFIIEGINDSAEELSAFKKYFEEIKPTQIQLNSLDRRGTCDWVKPASRKRLEEIQKFFAQLPVEIIKREVGK